MMSHPNVLDAPFSETYKLARDRSFFGITLTQFLGAFNDNFFKQAVLFAICYILRTMTLRSALVAWPAGS